MTSIDVFETKENIQPLKQGRVSSRLGTALQAQTNQELQQSLLKEKQQFEELIRSYDGDDPIQPWCDYVQWIEQTHVKHVGVDTLKTVLENCLAEFKDVDRYKQDSRYVKLWIRYINLSSIPLELFQQVFSHGIGTQCASFYCSWADEHIAMNSFKTADQIFKEGMNRNAVPKDVLIQAHINFQHLVARQMLDKMKDTSSSLNEETEQRQFMNPLKAKGKKNLVNNVRTGSSILSTQRGILKPLEPTNNKKKSKPIRIFTDDEFATPKFPEQELVKVPNQKQITKENTREAGKWNKGYMKIHPSTPLHPSFEVHEDEIQVKSSKKPSFNVLKPKKISESNFHCPLALFEPEDSTKIPMYPKKKVYTGGTEFSLEELRAMIYKKRYEQDRKEAESNISQECETSGELTSDKSSTVPVNTSDNAELPSCHDNPLLPEVCDYISKCNISGIELLNHNSSANENLEVNSDICEIGSYGVSTSVSRNLNSTSFLVWSEDSRQEDKCVPSNKFSVFVDDTDNFAQPAINSESDTCENEIMESHQASSFSNKPSDNVNQRFTIYTDDEASNKNKDEYKNCAPINVTPSFKKGGISFNSFDKENSNSKCLIQSNASSSISLKEDTKSAVQSEERSSMLMQKKIIAGPAHSLDYRSFNVKSIYKETDSEEQSMTLKTFSRQQLICSESQYQISQAELLCQQFSACKGTATEFPQCLQEDVLDNDDEDFIVKNYEPLPELPYIPSPGKSKQEIDDLESADDKENDCCPEYNQPKKYRKLAGILQESENIEFIPLDVQRQQASIYDDDQDDDLGVQPLCLD